MQTVINLTPEETAEFKSFADECDAVARGFALGMEQAKRMALERLLRQRQAVPPQDDPPQNTDPAGD